MTTTETILKELLRLRNAVAGAINRIEALEEANRVAIAETALRAEALDAQVTYTAMMSDTLLEV
ncbi:MAG: hypothetical protein IKU54_03915 [Oscillospiraceae bacterium]|nr:hypothetical protein [Oscillospiraceae bacterium]